MKSIHTKKLGLLHLDQKIGSGYFRDCYSVKNNKDLCLKISKKDIKLVRRLKAFVFQQRPNTDERNTFELIPEEIKPLFNPVIEAEKHYLLAKFPKNYDGTNCRSVKSHGPISNNHFWSDVDKLYNYLLKNNLWFFDLFNGNNMFVKKESELIWRPVFIDYKYGWRDFPWQINLVFRSEKKKKLRRRYRKFRHAYLAVSS